MPRSTIDAAAARLAMVARKFGPKAAAKDKRRREEAVKAAEQHEADMLKPLPPEDEDPHVDPSSMPAVEQTWAVDIRHGGKPYRTAAGMFTPQPYCDGIFLVSNGRPSRIDPVVETDSGVYPPSIEQAHLIAAAPELYRALVGIMATAEHMDTTSAERSAASDAAKAALAKAVGKTVTPKRGR
jgi:hypothetical protein